MPIDGYFYLYARLLRKFGFANVNLSGMLRKLCFALSLILCSGFISAQIGSGTLKGTVTDQESGEPLPFVNVIVRLNGNTVTAGQTDFDGKYSIKPIEPGSYEIEFTFVGYTPKKFTGVKVTSNKIAFLDAKLGAGLELAEAVVVEYKEPLIDKDGGASGGTVTREEIDKMPGRSAGAIAQTVGGVADTGNGISVRGARSNSTWYYIDGIKVRGSVALPKSAIEEIAVITGGIPASIGDATGGVINLSLRSSSANYSGGLEVITSGFRSGDGAVGLDAYGYNLVEGFLSGPLLSKKDEEGNRLEPILGFFLSGNYQNVVDSRPTFGGVYRMKEDVQQDLLDNPLRRNVAADGSVNGALYNADFLTADDFEKVDTRQNVGSTQANLVAKIDVNTGKNTNLTIGGTGAFSQRDAFSYGNMLMNYDNNLQVTEFDYRGYVKFSQRFSAPEDAEEVTSALQNVFYSVMVDYSQTYDRTWNKNHEDNFFRYGHVGTFDVSQVNSYEVQESSNFGGVVNEHVGWEDTLVTFTPSQYNPDLAAINNQYFGLFDIEPYNPDDPGPYATLLEVQNGNALRNGDSPDGTYNLWSHIGTQGNTYAVARNNQFRVSANGSADIGDHAIQLGFEYEQRRDASYLLGPIGLWTQARLLGNSHIKEIDQNNFSVDYIDGTLPWVTYERLIGDGQFEFDYRLREALGYDPLGNDFINTDALDPDQLTLDMFGADDLLNQGNQLVRYQGFDPYGNRVTGRPTLDDFFNDTNELGYRTRAIGAYEPIYMAGYVMDKFAFDDIIFNVGVRVDRFDANQPVPKDPYVIGEALSAGEVSELGDNEVLHPTNIGDDFVVYVDDVDNPNAIVGYRDGDTWYNGTGAVIENPDLIASTNGFPAPLLLNGSDEELSSNAFEDYTPQVNVMPRISFSFPISDEAVFFAHYDVLTQRPTSNNIFLPTDYLFLEARNELISNPAMRPSRTIDYELGFQQVLSKTSSLKIAAFYRELRDMIQVRNFAGAYPRPYRAFGNLDFGTVKGMTLAYDLRRTGNVRMNVSYTLQFADGTGSTTGTALALINAGLPNLRSINPFDYDQRHRIVANVDYRYGEGQAYNGPIWFGKQILKNTGFNLIGTLGSGTPYTASTIAYPVTGEISPSTEGSINGSRLPWNFTLNANIDRNFTIKYGSEDNPKTANLNVYLWVSNILNNRNIQGVYRFTGVADDDGYLAAAQYQPLINSQNNPDSFRNYYSMYANNPFNLAAPRTVRLGVRFDF